MHDALHLPMAASPNEELWRRAEGRRETALVSDLGPFERSLLSLVLSMARLSAQRDARSLAPPCLEEA